MRAPDRPRAVYVSASKHRWRISTDTGWTQGWWALTETGLCGALRQALRSCGMPVDRATTRFIVAKARERGYVIVGPPEVH